MPALYCLLLLLSVLSKIPGLQSSAPRRPYVTGATFAHTIKPNFSIGFYYHVYLEMVDMIRVEKIILQSALKCGKVT